MIKDDKAKKEMATENKKPADDDPDDPYAKLPLWKKNLMKKRAEEEAQKLREKQAIVSTR